MTELATNAPPNGNGEVLEEVLVGGNLSKLTPHQRASFYLRVCDSLSLNPLTRPFEYLVLNGRMILYARKDATDQLRSIRRVSLHIVSAEEVGELYVVTARATLPDGRHDEEVGAVAIGGLKGEARANAVMRAITKAKRRVTLSICGLGLTDESEVDAIPGARRVDEDGVIEDEPEPPEAPPGDRTTRHAAIKAAISVEDEPVLVEPASLRGEIEDEQRAELAERRRQVAAMNPPNERAVTEAPAGVPGDDVDTLAGEDLTEACLRMRRALNAANVPAPAVPKGEANMRVWWRHCAGLLSARA